MATRPTSTTSARASHRKLRLRPKVLTASATSGRNVAAAAAPRRSSSATAMHDRIPTPQLNRFLAEIGPDPPAARRAAATGCKLLYMAQSGTRPPRFAIQVNSRNRVTRDYAYFIENRLRARYGMDGVPLIIDFNERNERRGGAAGGCERAQGRSRDAQRPDTLPALSRPLTGGSAAATLP